jgi:hypothetical protein
MYASSRDQGDIHVVGAQDMGIPYFSNIPSNGCIYCCFFNDVIAG